MTAIESTYRLMGFPLYKVWPPVLQLCVHLPDQHTITMDPNEDLQEVAKRAKTQNSMHTVYFKKNYEEQKARQYLYREFPEAYWWDKPTKSWIERKQKRTQIGRMVYANPAEGERYYLRVLLCHVRGATSFVGLRTFGGLTLPTFRDACEVHGLMHTDASLDKCLAKAAEWQMPYSIRRLFAIIMVFCEATNIRKLWDKHFDALSKDYCRSIANPNVVKQMGKDISAHEAMGKDIHDYCLPEFNEQGE